VKKNIHCLNNYLSVLRRRRDILSLQEQYRFPISSNGYIFRNEGEPFRIPHEVPLALLVSRKIKSASTADDFAETEKVSVLTGPVPVSHFLKWVHSRKYGRTASNPSRKCPTLARLRRTKNGTL